MRLLNAANDNVPAPRHILALDIATTTGWASWREGEPRPEYGSVTFPGELGQFADGFENWLLAKIVLDDITHIEVEAPIPNHKFTNIHASLRLNWAHVNVFKIGYARGVSVGATNVGQWRHHFIGCRRAPKEIEKNKRTAWLKQASIAACNRHGWDVAGSHDAADALGLLTYVLNEHGLQWGVSCTVSQTSSDGSLTKSSSCVPVSSSASASPKSSKGSKKSSASKRPPTRLAA